jgi:hypothetical protein
VSSLVGDTMYLLAYIKETCRRFRDSLKALPEHRPDLIIKKVSTDQNHIHLLVSIPPSVMEESREVVALARLPEELIDVALLTKLELYYSLQSAPT